MADAVLPTDAAANPLLVESNGAPPDSPSLIVGEAPTNSGLAGGTVSADSAPRACPLRPDAP